MNSDLRELLALTKLHLKQEYEHDANIPTDPETHAFFKNYAKVQKKQISYDAPVAKEIKQTVNLAPPAYEMPIANPQKKEPIVEKKRPPPPTVDSLKIQTEKIAPNHHQDLSDIQKIMNEQFSHVTIHNAPPEDSQAKSFANKWKSQPEYPDVLIINFKETSEELTFLANMAKGIQQKLAPADLMPVDKWDAESEKIFESGRVKLILTSESVIKLLQNMIRIEGEERYLRDIPLLTLNELSSYSRDPQLKMALWKNIQRVLQLSRQPTSQ